MEENKTFETGMIMDAVQNNTETTQETLSTAIGSMPNISQYIPRKPKQMKREYTIGRNDECPCGSGKKYKKCCLSTGKYENLVEV